MNVGPATGRETPYMNKESGWKRMMFKGHKVWLRVDSHDNPVVRDTKVLIKYRLDQDYEYWVPQRAVKPIDPQALKAAGPAKASLQRPLPPSTLKEEAAAPGTVFAYTDGAASGNPGPAGIGVFLRCASREKEISKPIGTATNNVAELIAIKIALETIRNRRAPVRLYTDSQYCYGLLVLGWKARKNAALVADIKGLIKKFKNLKILKVEGHAGVEENERADRLARAAAKEARKSSGQTRSTGRPKR
jgi:ribonuclease HI